MLNCYILSSSFVKSAKKTLGSTEKVQYGNAQGYIH